MNFKVLFVDTAHPSLKENLEKLGYNCVDFSEGAMQENALKTYHGIVIRSKFKLTKEQIDRFVNLKWIARVGAGMENIDLKYAESKGITCLHAPEGNRNAVAEQAMGMLLMLLNNLRKADREVRQGIWKREENRGFEIEGKTVGIIGYGNTGQAFARKLIGFDCQILAFDKYKTEFSNQFVKESSLNDLFENADILSIHLPLTDETRYMVDENFLYQFKKPIWFINTSRGEIVRTKSIINGLKNGKIKGAALDVLEFESVSFEQFNLTDDLKELSEIDQVVLSPHIAGWTHESNQKMADVLVMKIKQTDKIQ